MLFDIAAVLTTSVALGTVAEAVGVPVAGSHETAVVRTLGAWSGALPGVAHPIPDAPTPFVGPQPTGPRAPGMQVLQELSLISADGIRQLIAADATLPTSLLAVPPAATDVGLWWKALKADQRAALRDAAPGLVGNLDGVPYAARDLANRTLLAETIRRLDTTIQGEAGRTVVENAKQQLRMLQSIADALVSPAAGPPRSLLSLDVEGQGRAAIVIGDLRRADYVSYLVPGMFFTIENQMDDWTDAASRLHDEQLAWLDYFAQRRGGGQPATVATIAWIGYHTPNLTNIGGVENAQQGRDSLAAALEGLHAIRTGAEPYVTVIAHSYGSTAALMALTERDVVVDALALVGSPGSAAKSVDELRVRGGNVYVGEASWDPVPNSSYFGSDPGAPSYGARRMDVTGGVDALTGAVLHGSVGHNEYFGEGTQSMRNFALISIGMGQYVSSPDGAVVARGVAR